MTLGVREVLGWTRSSSSEEGEVENNYGDGEHLNLQDEDQEEEDIGENIAMSLEGQ